MSEYRLTRTMIFRKADEKGKGLDGLKKGERMNDELLEINSENYNEANRLRKENVTLTQRVKELEGEPWSDPVAAMKQVEHFEKALRAERARTKALVDAVQKHYCCVPPKIDLQLALAEYKKGER